MKALIVVGFGLLYAAAVAVSLAVPVAIIYACYELGKHFTK